MTNIFNSAVAEQGAATMEPNQRVPLDGDLLWGMGHIAMIALAYKADSWFPGEIRRNAALPDRPVEVSDWDYTTLDKTWALGTLEMTAWTFASDMTMTTFGLSSIFWLLNRFLDGEGGDLHQIYYRMAQFQYYVTPVLLFGACARLISAHNAGISTSSYEKAYWVTYMSETWGQPHFYDYSSYSDSDLLAYTSDERSKMATFFYGAIGWAALARATFGSIKADYEEARETEFLEDDGDSVEEEAVVEEVVAEEEFFF